MDPILIEHRLIKTSVAMWVSSIVTLIIQLASVPICLHFWGYNTYGMWLTILAAFTIMRTADYGYVLYVGNEINILYHNDQNAMRLNLASAIWGILILGVLQLLFLIIIYAGNSIHVIIGSQSSYSYNEIFQALLIMSVCWICSASYMGIVHRILNPLGMLYQSTWMMMWLQVVQFIAIITAAIINLSLVYTAILFSLVQLISYIASAIYIKKALPQYFPWWKNSSPKVGLKNIINSLPQTLGWMMTQGGINGIILLIASFLGPAAVPIFTTLRTISNLWIILINSFTQPVIPDAVRFYATGKPHKLISINQVHGILISGVVNLSLLMIYPFIEKIFTVWTGNHLYFDRILLNLLLATISISGMSALMGAFLAGINNVGYIIISSALRGVLVLILGWALLPKYGMPGLGMAIFIAEILNLLVINIWFLTLEKGGGKLIMRHLEWSWFSTISVTAYLIAQCYKLHYISFIYWTSILMVLTCTLGAWLDLHHTFKSRVIFLIQKHGWRK